MYKQTEKLFSNFFEQVQASLYDIYIVKIFRPILAAAISEIFQALHHESNTNIAIIHYRNCI